MIVKLINKNNEYTKVGNIVNGVNLDDLLVIEEIYNKRYKIWSPNYRLFFNKIGKAFEITFIRDKEEYIIRKKVLNLIYEKGELTFDDLEIEIPESNGKEVYCFNENHFLVIWDALNRMTINVIRNLLRESKIKMEICNKDKYVNSSLELPITNDIKIPHKKPHWLPIILKKNNKFSDLNKDIIE